MNITAGLTKLKEIENEIIHVGDLRQILEAMETPEDEFSTIKQRFSDIEQRLSRLEGTLVRQQRLSRLEDTLVRLELKMPMNESVMVLQPDHIADATKKVTINQTEWSQKGGTTNDH